MAELTKEQLIEKVAQLEKQVEQRDEALKKLTAKGEGWLITTPNPVYDAQVYGIQFVNGQAFVRKDQVVPFFEFEPMKESSMDKLNYTPEQRKVIREQEKKPSAQRAIEAFMDDFGYTVEFFGAERLLELQQRIDNRLNQRVQAEALQAQQAEAEKLIAPGYRR